VIESAPSTQLAIKIFTAFFISLLPFSDRARCRRSIYQQ
jgi:hypothetical protein